MSNRCGFDRQGSNCYLCGGVGKLINKMLDGAMMAWSSLYTAMIGRNIGILSDIEQEKLRQSCVAVAGCGGIGGMVAEQLVRVGVGHLKIADPDSFELSNLNRQTCSTFFTQGMNKAAVLGRYLCEINPELQLATLTDGVEQCNVEEFVDGADMVVDAIDYRRFFDSVVLHREARNRGVCTVNPQAVGFGASVLVFGRNTVAIEEYVGLSVHASREELESFAVPIEKFCPHIPSYADISLVERVASGEADIPTVVMGLHFSSAIAVAETVALLLGRAEQPTGLQPRTYVMDFLDRKFTAIDQPSDCSCQL